MTTDHWVEAALTNDALVAGLLLRMKHSSDSDSLRTHTPPLKASTSTSITTVLPPLWGNRKNRSKSTASTTTVTNGFGKEHRGSPTTHLSWSGGGGSTSDGYDEPSRPSDLSSGSRSLKGNEAAPTSSYNKSHKRKSYIDHKDEECSLLKKRTHINKVFLNDQEMTSMLVTLNQQKATSEKLQEVKVNWVTSVEKSCRVETEGAERGGFILPDLNMPANDEMDIMILE